jgi:hypothetical protein
MKKTSIPDNKSIQIGLKRKPVHTGLYLVRVEESLDESPLSFFIGVLLR